jgi:ribosomal protein S6--L-glutamate ligase
MIIHGKQQLKAHYSRLQKGDVLIGRLPENPLKQAMLVDLLEQGVRCLPSALAQMLSRSKAAQAFVFENWMVPPTCVVTRRAELIAAINAFQQKGFGPVITKQDHKHCGHGIRRWDSVEMVYNTIGFSKEAYPFILQPFLNPVSDVRVIIIGDYEEAYMRHNPTDFRHNIAVGGYSNPLEMNATLKAFCLSVMKRGKFPYAHIDLLIAEDNTVYLSEIALEGGIKGARIHRTDMADKKRLLLDQLADSLHKEANPSR